MDVIASNPVRPSPPPLRVLILEDDPLDAKLTARVLEGGGFKVQLEITDSQEVFRKRLDEGEYDVILADFNLRDWTALDALEILKDAGKDIPLIVTTGSLGDEPAADCIKHGAADFVLKDRPARLPAAVWRALEDRRLRAENLRAFEAVTRLATIVESSDDAIIGKTLEGMITSWNKGAEKLYGYSPAEVVGKSITLLAPPDRPEEISQILARLKQGERVEHFESVRVRKDGSRVDVSLSIFPLTDSQGGVTGAASIARDITQNKQAERNLRESRERFRLLFASNPLPMWVYDRETLQFLEVNDAAVAHYGYAREEFLGMRITDIRPAEEVALLQQNFLQARPPLEETGPWRHRLKDGRIIRVNITSHILEWNGRPAALVVAQDVTERLLAQEALRESEERYRQLFEHNLAGVFRTTQDGHILDCNQAMATMLGFDSPQVVLSHNVREFYFSAEDRTAFFRDLMITGWVTDYELRMRRQDGTALWLIANVSMRTPAAGGQPLIEGTLVDISDRKHAEERRREYEKAVEGLEEMLAVVDRDYRYVLANQAFLKYRGMEGKEIAGRTVRELMGGPLFESIIKRKLDECFTGKVVEYELKAEHPRLGVRDLFASLFPIEGAQGVDRVAVIVRDITESKRAEVALREEKNRAQMYLDIAGVMLLALNANQEVVLINLKGCEILGYPREEILGKRWCDHFLPERDRDRLNLAFEKLVRGELENVASLENSIISKSGEERLISWHNTLIRDEAGRIVATLSSGEDITERKRADEALRGSEERFRRIADTISEVFWTADPQISRIHYVSPGYEKVWGRSVESLYRNPRSFLDAIHDEDRDQVVAILKTQEAGKPFDHEYRIVRPDGSPRWIWDRGFPVMDETGHITCYVGVAQDITERKRGEAERARLAMAIEQSAEAVVITNPQGAIEYVNPAFSSITGYSRQEALGQNPRILKSGSHDGAFYQKLWETISRGENWRGELVNRRKDGTSYTEMMSITPVRGARGEITHFIAAKQDVTERKTLEAQLQQAAKMEAVGRLAGGVAHDFNNLLTIINGYAELLLESLAADHKIAPPLKEIKNAGERAATLTRQLLAFSRKQVLAPQVLNLNAVVSNLEKMLKRLIGEDIKLRTVLDPELGRVKADPGQIEQVIMNLAVNARDAMPRGGNLTIETGNVELDETYAQAHVTVKAGPHVMLAVADTGVGMSAETKARIFEPFFTTKEQGRGTGLGLATVYGIVKQSEGSIWVYSEVDQGTVFKIYLPLVTETVTAAGRSKKAVELATGSETLLVVEDEEGVRSLIHLALASAGYKVLETLDPDKALEICAAHDGPIHLLLTDVVMPKMSGHTVAEKVSAMRPGIKVLYMSGYTDDSVVHHGVLSQDSPFIQKPFSPYALRKKIREVLEGK